MRIESSQISYASAYQASSVTATIDKTMPAVQSAPHDTVTLSSTSDRTDLQDLDPKQRLAWLAIEAILGHRIRFVGVHTAAGNGASAGGGAQIHQRTEIHTESEQSSFQAEGTVQTSDGRTIQFSASLTMQRESSSVNSSTGPATDPLVVNFGGGAARLTGAKVSFDLNSDGNPENISFVGQGSGFLALDRNGDNKVNNGSELFGPKTGNGFSELAAYDADQNGWIDENDPVFSQLRIWDQTGLSTLAEKGIGAIATSNVETPFTLTGAGAVRSSGVYLNENGGGGTIQQVDLNTG